MSMADDVLNPETVDYETVNGESMTDLHALTVKDTANTDIVHSDKANFDLMHIDRQTMQTKCKEFVDLIVKSKLPPALQNSKDIVDLVDMSKNMQAYSLGMMLTVCRRAYDAVNNITIDDMYSADAMLDPFKVQTMLGAYQTVMNLAAQLSLFVQRLPGIMGQAIQDATMLKVIELQADMRNEQEQHKTEQETYSGNVSALPMAVLMKQAQLEAEERANIPIERAAAPETIAPDDIVDTDVDLNDADL